jgi:wobble nucleotide-excising tRNase
MTKLKSSTNILDKPIIWIDDPISSLDSNHIFLVYSLIRAEVVEKGEYEQLFVSTHNLNFLKYLKRITGKNKDKNLGFYLIEKNIFSEIHIMPEYLREYTTEFNYLFEKIYDCAKQNNKADYYGFANNARKFIEILMFFNYPNHEDNETLTKLKRYFDDDSQSAFFIDRINNEYSHLSGSLERGEIVVDVPEIQRSANLILDKIKEKNHDQYAALEKSIGICMPAPEC